MTALPHLADPETVLESDKGSQVCILLVDADHVNRIMLCTLCFRLDSLPNPGLTLGQLLLCLPMKSAARLTNIFLQAPTGGSMHLQC